MADLLIQLSDRGQLTLPAEFRRRWQTKQFLVVDNGHSLELHPVPDDPVTELLGKYRGLPTSSDVGRDEDRSAEAERDEAR